MFTTYYGEILALITTLSWAICIFPFTEASVRLGPDTVNHYRLLLACLVLTMILLFFNGISFHQLFSYPSLHNWFWLGLSGIVGLALADYFGFIMYTILGSKFGSLFTTLSPGATLLFSYFLLGESLTLVSIIGIFITIGGIGWLILSKPEDEVSTETESPVRRKGILYGILYAVFEGIGLVMAKKGFSNPDGNNPISPIHGTWIRMVVATIGIFGLTFLMGKLKTVSRSFFLNTNKGTNYLLIAILFGPVTAVSLSLYSISLIKVSVARTIFALIPVFVLPLSYILYKEKITLRVLTGAVIAISGVLIVIWGERIEAILINL